MLPVVIRIASGPFQYQSFQINRKSMDLTCCKVSMFCGRPVVPFKAHSSSVTGVAHGSSFSSQKQDVCDFVRPQKDVGNPETSPQNQNLFSTFPILDAKQQALPPPLAHSQSRSRPQPHTPPLCGSGTGARGRGTLSSPGSWRRAPRTPLSASTPPPSRASTRRPMMQLEDASGPQRERGDRLRLDDHPR